MLRGAGFSLVKQLIEFYFCMSEDEEQNAGKTQKGSQLTKDFPAESVFRGILVGLIRASCTSLLIKPPSARLQNKVDVKLTSDQGWRSTHCRFRRLRVIQHVHLSIHNELLSTKCTVAAG